jgi:hypothetical protein
MLPEVRNMSHIPSAIGVPWFRRESYDRIKTLPGSDLRDSFEQWEERAHRMFNVMYAAGQPVTRIVLEPEELRAFAEEMGADAITASVRAELANRKLEKRQNEKKPAVADLFCPRCGKRHSYPEGTMRVVEAIQISCECGERLRKPSPLGFTQSAQPR